MVASAVTTIAQGASIFRIEVGGQNILLSYPDPALHASHPHQFFGETIGRVANRIEGARLPTSDGPACTLTANDGANCLHGGTRGWGKAVWSGPQYVRRGRWEDEFTAVEPLGGSPMPTSVAGKEPERPGVLYEHHSPDGDQGFPGALLARVWYFEARDRQGRVVLESEYEVQWADSGSRDEDDRKRQETVIGMTNHSYFNLNPRSATTSPTLEHHVLTLPTSTHLTLSATKPGIPDGSLTPHPRVAPPHQAFSLFDARTRTAVPIDDCFVVDPHATTPVDVPLDTRHRPLQLLAHLASSASGIALRVESTEPAFQCYTGGFIDVPPWPAGKVEGRAYEAGPGFAQYAGICLEPSRYVNAAGRAEWRAMVTLRRGQVYGARTRYTAWKT